MHRSVCVYANNESARKVRWYKKLTDPSADENSFSDYKLYFYDDANKKRLHFTGFCLPNTVVENAYKKLLDQQSMILSISEFSNIKL